MTWASSLWLTPDVTASSKIGDPFGPSFADTTGQAELPFASVASPPPLIFVDASLRGTNEGWTLVALPRYSVVIALGRALLIYERPAELVFRPASPAPPTLVTAEGTAFASSPHLHALKWIKSATGLPYDRIARLIGVTRQTINRWSRGEPIVDRNRRRLFAVREVLERAAIRHPTPAQLAAWLYTPRGTDGRTPADLLERGDIDRARLLALSIPSPRLRRAPAWTRRPVHPAFREGAEHRQEALPPERDDQLSARYGHPGNDDDEEETAPNR